MLLLSVGTNGVRSTGLSSASTKRVRLNLGAIYAKQASTMSLHRDFYHAVYFAVKAVGYGDTSKSTRALLAAAAKGLDGAAALWLHMNPQEAINGYMMLASLRSIPTVYANDPLMHLKNLKSTR